MWDSNNLRILSLSSPVAAELFLQDTIKRELQRPFNAPS
jgi:hypothetical protein